MALNQKLTAWWKLDFPGFHGRGAQGIQAGLSWWRRARTTGRYGSPPGRAEHEQRTAEIVRLETQLNTRVYVLFDLSAAEIKIVEESTKYRCELLASAPSPAPESR